jgi:hypothetical protein
VNQFTTIKKNQRFCLSITMSSLCLVYACNKDGTVVHHNPTAFRSPSTASTVHSRLKRMLGCSVSIYDITSKNSLVQLFIEADQEDKSRVEFKLPELSKLKEDADMQYPSVLLAILDGSDPILPSQSTASQPSASSSKTMPPPPLPPLCLPSLPENIQSQRPENLAVSVAKLGNSTSEVSRSIGHSDVQFIMPLAIEDAPPLVQKFVQNCQRSRPVTQKVQIMFHLFFASLTCMYRFSIP